MTAILSNVLVSAITALLAVNLALKRFYREKWWERKLDAYLKLFEALHHLSVPFDRAIEAAIESREVAEAERERLWKLHTAAEVEILKQLDMGELLISSDAVSLLRNMMRLLNEARARTEHMDYLTANQGAIWNCLGELKPLAKKDLQVDDSQSWSAALEKLKGKICNYGERK